MKPATKPPPRFRPKPSRRCLPAMTCWPARRPAPARPPRSRCRYCTACRKTRPQRTNSAARASALWCCPPPANWPPRWKSRCANTASTSPSTRPWCSAASAWPPRSSACSAAWTSWWPPPAACSTCSTTASSTLPDRMLDMGFIQDVKKVLALVPGDKQSLLFSATFSDDIRELANSLLKNPQSIQVTPRNSTVQRIAQVIHPVGRGKKKQVLRHIIEQHDWSQVLVFTRTKFGANSVAEFLTKNGVNAMALHGNKSQSARTQALADFKNGDIRALVATDIAARGIDIDELPHVVNYEIPNVPEDYVNRIGRTGRAGATGQAVSLVCMDEEGFMMDIERFTQQQIPVQPIEGFGPEPGEKAEPLAMRRQTPPHRPP